MIFEDLLAPYDQATFLAEVRGKSWLHVPGDEAKGRAVFDYPQMNDILDMDVWNATTLTMMMDGQRVPPPAYCERAVNRNKLTVMRPDPAKVREILRHGASLVLDDVASLVPSVQGVVETLERTFNARIGTNIYFSQQRHRAFHSHYDRHDVFALQIHGEKLWRIYKGREDNPIEHERFLNLPQADYDRIKGAVDAEVRMTPGDLLYLPRGQCHDALASSERSLHITFGCVLPMGLHLVEDMVTRLIDESLFRADLPRPDTAEGEAELADRLQAMMLRLSEIYGGDNGLKLAKQMIENFNDDPVTRFTLPES